MTATAPVAKTNYDAMTSDEQEAWKCHREIVYSVPQDIAGYRGCIGLAVIIDKVTPDTWIDRPNKTFLRDADMRWASITDIPTGYFRVENRKREVHWATLRRTTLSHGMPALLRGTEGKDAWDFRVIPRTAADVAASRVEAYPHALDLDAHPQLARLFNAMEWAMTSVAFSERRAWNPGRSLFAKAYGQEDATKPLYVFGGSAVRNVYPRVYEYMPQAYIGFPVGVDASQLFTRCVYPLARTALPPTFPDAFRGAAVDAAMTGFAYFAPFKGKVRVCTRDTYGNVPVYRIELAGDQGESATVYFPRETSHLMKGEGTAFAYGEQIAVDKVTSSLPANWLSVSRADRWGLLKQAAGRHLLASLRCWFARQREELVDGYYHWPLALVETMAMASSAEAGLFWETARAAEYLRDDCGALVLPPVPIRKWYELEGTLPGAVRFDLHPVSDKYETFQESKRRTHAGEDSAAVLPDQPVDRA